MSGLGEIVETLELRIKRLLEQQESLRRENSFLQEGLDELRAENSELREGLEVSEKRIQSLKAANALLGSNEFKRETKLKINGLIREIDQCIVQLSE